MLNDTYSLRLFGFRLPGKYLPRQVVYEVSPAPLISLAFQNWSLKDYDLSAEKIRLLKAVKALTLDSDKEFRLSSENDLRMSISKLLFP